PAGRSQHVHVHDPAGRALRLRVDDSRNAVQGQFRPAGSGLRLEPGTFEFPGIRLPRRASGNSAGAEEGESGEAAGGQGRRLMPTLVLLRHGQSQWNLENRFTGWWDVDLSEQGVTEARAAGVLLKQRGYEFDRCFTSVLT